MKMTAEIAYKILDSIKLVHKFLENDEVHNALAAEGKSVDWDELKRIEKEATFFLIDKEIDEIRRLSGK